MEKGRRYENFSFGFMLLAGSITNQRVIDNPYLAVIFI